MRRLSARVDSAGVRCYACVQRSSAAAAARSSASASSIAAGVAAPVPMGRVGQKRMPSGSPPAVLCPTRNSGGTPRPDAAGALRGRVARPGSCVRVPGLPGSGPARGRRAYRGNSRASRFRTGRLCRSRSGRCRSPARRGQAPHRWCARTTRPADPGCHARSNGPRCARGRCRGGALRGGPARAGSGSLRSRLPHGRGSPKAAARSSVARIASVPPGAFGIRRRTCASVVGQRTSSPWGCRGLRSPGPRLAVAAGRGSLLPDSQRPPVESGRRKRTRRAPGRDRVFVGVRRTRRGAPAAVRVPGAV